MTNDLFERLQHKLATQNQATGLTMADLHQLADGERKLANWLLRTGEVSDTQLTARWGEDEETRNHLASLVEKGFVQEKTVEGVRHYALLLGARRKRELPANLWHALTDKLDHPKGS